MIGYLQSVIGLDVGVFLPRRQGFLTPVMARSAGVTLPMEMKGVLERIAMASAERGLSERALCLNAGLSDSTVKNWRKAVREKKNPGANEKSLTAIANALGVTRDWLVNGEPNGFSEPSGPQPRIDVSRIPDRSELIAARNTHGDTVGTIKIALVDGVLQVAATVDQASIGKLIKQLETFRAALDDTD